jgi:hypothetical protein
VVAKDQLPTPPLAEQQYEDHHSRYYYADRAYHVGDATKSQREIDRFENDGRRIGDH